MPKFLAVKVSTTTFETFADSVEEAEAAIKKWQEGESEEPEGGIRVITRKMGWVEFEMSDTDIIQGRNQALLNFLDIMKNHIPGMPQVKEEESLILKPFDPFPDVPMNKDRKEGRL